jgi:surface protein
MFSQAYSFNQDLSSWDTSSVIDMSSMFSEAAAFNQDLFSWNTSSVTDMSRMFIFAVAFNQDMSAWNTSFVTDTSEMFSHAHAFNQDISAWDTSSVTDVTHMFENAWSFNTPISWNLSATKDMFRMLCKAFSFNQNLCGWGYQRIPALSIYDWFDMFHRSGCAVEADPNALNSSEGPWCHICSPAASIPEPRYTILVLDGPPLEIPFLCKNATVDLKLVNVPFTSVTCQTNANNGDIDIYMKQNGRVKLVPFLPGCEVMREQCSSTSPHSNETVKLHMFARPMEYPHGVHDIYIVLHAFSQTANTSIICCSGSDPCFSFEHAELILNDTPFKMTFLSRHDRIYFQLTGIASGTTVTCETQADSGDIDLYMKGGQWPTIDPDAPDQEVGYSGDSNETATLTTQETSDIYVVVHAYSETSNAMISCCIGQGPCFLTI